MRFPLFIAKRYLIAKKSHTAINLISGISLVGVALGTMALVVVLSVFNGFDNLIQSLFNAFDPDLKITAVEGKVFTTDNETFRQIRNHPGVLYFSEVLEENAMLEYRDKQNVASLKGVDSNYMRVTGLDAKITEGVYKPDDSMFYYGIVGAGIAYNLTIAVNLFDPLFVYIPRRTEDISSNPQDAFVKKYIYPSATFAIEQDFDAKYVIVSLPFMRRILDYSREVSSVEVKTSPGADVNSVQQDIQKIAGDKFVIKNRFQQQELFYKIMKVEKWAIFFILSFILIVASFNIIGSLAMLIIDKKKDIVTYNNLGADWRQIRRIFMIEGWLITLSGAVVGLVLGLIICWAQMTFKIVKLEGTSSFIIDHYPVIIKGVDFVVILAAVAVIGFFAAWIPSRLISEKHFNSVS